MVIRAAGYVGRMALSVVLEDADSSGYHQTLSVLDGRDVLWTSRADVVQADDAWTGAHVEGGVVLANLFSGHLVRFDLLSGAALGRRFTK